MPNKIKDPSEIKNSINGFDIASCHKYDNISIYITFPNLGSGIIAPMVASRDKSLEGLETDNNYTYLSKSLNDSNSGLIKQKNNNITAYSGSDINMYILALDISHGCDRNRAFSNSLKLPIPFKVAADDTAKDYISNMEQTILDNLLISQASAADFDIYTALFNYAKETINGSSTDISIVRKEGIVASIIRYAVSTIDKYNKVNIEDDELTYPATKWSLRDSTDKESLSALSSRVEFSELFEDNLMPDLYYIKIAEGRENAELSDVFVKPSVFYVINDDSSSRVYYSEELSNNIFNSLMIEGSSVPPSIEYKSTAITFGDMSRSIINTENYPEDQLQSVTGIDPYVYDMITGSGKRRTEFIDNKLLSDIDNMIVLTDETSTTEETKNISLVTPRPPFFNNGEYGCINYGDSYIFPIAFSDKYCLPFTGEGYLPVDTLPDGEYSRTEKYDHEGFYSLMGSMKEYIDILNKYVKDRYELTSSPFPEDNEDLINICENRDIIRFTDSDYYQSFDVPQSGRLVFADTADQLNYVLLWDLKDISDKDAAPDVSTAPMKEDYETDEEYQAVLKKYDNELTALDNFFNTRDSSINYLKKCMYGLGELPSEYFSYDSSKIHPVIMKTGIENIRSQPDSSYIKIKPDHGVSLLDTKTPSISTIMNNVNVSLSGEISPSSVFLPTSNLLSPDSKVIDILEMLYKIILQVENYIDDSILKTANAEDIDTPGGSYKVPSFTNPNSFVDLILNGNLSPDGYHLSDESIIMEESHKYFFSKLKSIFNNLVNNQTEKGKYLTSFYKKYKSYLSDPSIDLKTESENLIEYVLIPAINYCDCIIEILLAKDQEKYLFYTEYDGSYHYFKISGDMTKRGYWFYNLRKQYLLLISAVTVIQGHLEALLNYSVSISKKYSNKYTTSEVKNDKYFKAFSFYQQNGNPLYPILKEDLSLIDILELNPPVLNNISRLFPEDKFIYPISLEYSGSEPIDGSSVVLFPGMGVPDIDGLDLDEHRFFWDGSSVFTEISEDLDKELINTPFNKIRDIISSKADYIYKENSQLYIYSKNEDSYVPCSKEQIQDLVKSSSKSVPLVPDFIATGNIDAGFIFPFYDEGVNISASNLDIDALFEVNEPTSVSTSIDFSDGISYNYSAFQDSLRSKEIIHNFAAELFKQLTSELFLEQILVNPDVTMHVKIIGTSSPSPWLGKTPMTNSSLQGIMLRDMFSSFNITDADIIGELNNTSWLSFNIEDPTDIQKRNYNLFLSKRRAFYVAERILYELIDMIKQKYSNNLTLSVNGIELSLYGYTIKIVNSETEPSTTGVLFKLFDCYGVDSIFNRILYHTKEDNHINTTYVDALKIIGKVSYLKDQMNTIGYAKENIPMQFHIDFNNSKVSFSKDNINSLAIHIKNESGEIIYPYISHRTYNDDKTIDNKVKHYYGRFRNALLDNYGISDTDRNDKFDSTIMNESFQQNVYQQVKAIVEANLDALSANGILGNIYIIIENNN